MANIYAEILAEIAITGRYFEKINIDEILSKLPEDNDIFTREWMAKRIRYIKASSKLLVKIASFPIEHDQLTQLESAVANIRSFFSKVGVLTENERKALLNNLIFGFVSNFKVFSEVITSIAIAEIMNNDGFFNYLSLTKYLSQAKDKASRLELDAVNLLTRIRSVNDEAEQTKVSIDKIAEDLGVAKYREIFNREAELYKNASKQWLWAVVGILLLLFIGAVCLLAFAEDTDVSPQGFIVKVSNRIIIATSLFIGLSFCLKGYKTSRHNQILNKHRENAISSFHDFINSAKNDEATKNAILLEVTKTIFANQNTGYASADNEVEGSSKIIEIIRNIPKQTS